MKAILRESGQESIYRDLMQQLNAAHGVKLENVRAINDFEILKTQIVGELTSWLSASRVYFKPDMQALRDRLVYLPSRSSKSIFVSGNTGLDCLNIFEVMPSAVGIGKIAIPQEAGCLVVVPLLSGQGIEGKPFNFHGFMLVEKDKPAFFDPSVDLPIIQQAAMDMGVVMLEKNFSL